MSPSPVDTKDSTISSLKSELTLAGHELGSDLVDREKSDNLDLHVYPKRGRALVLLFIFALSVGIDVLSGSAFFVFTGPIARDFSIGFGEQTWVINAYSITFGSFLLFWGRVADLNSAKPVFCWGFMAVGACNLIISFLPEKYSLFLFRAITGVAGAALVPSAYRLIAATFPPEQRHMAYTIYGMTGSIANVLGTVIAGVIDLIPNEGQMRSYRWFFRIMAAISIPTAIIALRLIPNDRDHTRVTKTTKEKLKLMDFPGIITMFLAVLLLIIGLTFGSTYGWKSAAFLAPFIISFILFPLFFAWESRIPEIQALVPPAIWRIPNVTVLLAFSLITFGWWMCNFLVFIEMFNQVYGETMLLAAVRTLPEGIAAAIVSVMFVSYPSISKKPKWPIAFAMVFCVATYAVWSQAPSVVGRGYWTHIFYMMLLGSGGMQFVLLSTNVGIMMAAPSERTGTIGAMYQTALQIGGVIALSIQGGMLSVNEGGIHNFANVRLSFYVEVGICAVWLLGFVFLYKPEKSIKKDGEEAQVAIH